MRRVLFLFPHPGRLPRIQLPSPRAHTARTPRLKEVGPKGGSGILPFLLGFLGQMCIRTLKRKGAAELRRILGRVRWSGFAGDRGSDGYRERLGSKAPSGETLPSFSRLPHLWMGIGGLAKVPVLKVQSRCTRENPSFSKTPAFPGESGLSVLLQLSALALGC